jgi:putative tryptophan/tyrosine transport system substrate-binding protein
MRRRAFIEGVAAFGVAWPLAARAQQSSVPVIGFLSYGSPEAYPQALAAFQKGLNELGFVDGQNLTIEYRWAGNEYAQFPSLAADLVRRQVNVVVVLGSTPGTLAAKAATTTIPIVFGVGEDPVKLGLVASLARPGGNLTGINFLAN